MLTRPKDNNKRRVILNLSHLPGNSINEEVNRFEFDNRPFTLRLPVIDDITEAIHDKQDPVLFKIDIARAFRNLRADPVEALKFGIRWQDQYFLDGGIAFGWVHGTSVFQMVKDTIAHIMRKHNMGPYPSKFENSLPLGFSRKGSRTMRAKNFHDFSWLAESLGLH